MIDEEKSRQYLDEYARSRERLWKWLAPVLIVGTILFLWYAINQQGPALSPYGGQY